MPLEPPRIPKTVPELNPATLPLGGLEMLWGSQNGRTVRWTINDVLDAVILAGAVPSTRRVDTTDGLQGGGDLSANRTLSLTDTGVVAATYGSASQVGQFTVDAKGRVTSATNVSITTTAIGAVPTSRMLTAGTGLAGGGDLSADRSFALANTTVTPNAYGSASSVAAFIVDAQGRLTTALDVPIAIGAGAIISGTIDTARISGSYTGITGVGTVTVGTWSASFGANVVGDAALRQSAGLSVIGRGANTTGNVADITAGSDNTVLRRSGTTLAFGTINAGSFTANAIANADIRQSSGLSVIGRSTNTTGNVADITASVDGTVLRLNGTTLGFGTLASGAFGANVVGDAALRQSAGLSVIGRSANTTGNVADITAGSDNTVLRRSGTTIGFGTINAGSFTANAIANADIRQSVGVSVVGRSTNSTGNVADITAAADDRVLARTGGALSFVQLTAGMVPNDLITNAMLANMATQTFKGRTTAGTGDPEDLTITQALALLFPSWTQTTPTPTSGSGTITTANSILRKYVAGKIVFFGLEIAITTNGTGATDVRVDLGGSNAALTVGFGGRREDTSWGIAAQLGAGTTSLLITRASDGTYPGASGAIFAICGVYETV